MLALSVSHSHTHTHTQTHTHTHTQGQTHDREYYVNSDTHTHTHTYRHTHTYSKTYRGQIRTSKIKILCKHRQIHTQQWQECTFGTSLSFPHSLFYLSFSLSHTHTQPLGGIRLCTYREYTHSQTHAERWLWGGINTHTHPE